MQKFSSTGLSLPKDILSKIDQERGDIPRSRYILRILERMYLNTGTQGHEKKKANSSVSLRPQTLESRNP